jgi:hypothetical protein
MATLSNGSGIPQAEHGKDSGALQYLGSNGVA